MFTQQTFSDKLLPNTDFKMKKVSNCSIREALYSLSTMLRSKKNECSKYILRQNKQIKFKGVTNIMHFGKEDAK